jgi:hypothetical protein
VRKKYFCRTLANGEKVKREWLIYSLSKGCVFCYVCKVFGDSHVGESQFQSGYDDWKNASSRISSHEHCKEHLSAIQRLTEMQTSRRIDAELLQHQEKEKQYWIEVLKRVVSVISFLAERGLAFRGDSEVLGCQSNGNFLGCIELVSKFDPFLADHLCRYGNRGKGNVSYLSSTICDEFIHELASCVHAKIIAEVKTAKYYGVSIDSTPDISHVDQLAIIIRYTLPMTGRPVERFLQFLPIEEHTGEHLFDNLEASLKQDNIDINNCRSVI